MEMDDEQEQEHEQEQDPIDEPDYDDQDDDADDDMDDEDGDVDADDDDDQDEADDDDQDDALVAASRNGIRPSAQDSVLSAATYLRKVQERRALFRPPPACSSTTLGYQIEPMAAAPHSSHIHALALSLDGQTLLTGGSDGYVRKYDVHATMNGKTMLTQNVRHGFVEGITRGGTLTAFWPHEEHLPTNGVASSSSSTLNPPTRPEKDRLIGVIHSLAIQQDALWGLSGSESGNIHLYGLRHDPGGTRHVFRKHKGAVSTLALTQDETSMISGGWDRGIHQWDLNAGSVVRSFPGHAGQISSLAFRPYAVSQSHQEGTNIAIHPSAVGSNGIEVDEDEEDKVRNEGAGAETGDSANQGEKEDQSAKLVNGDAEDPSQSESTAKLGSTQLDTDAPATSSAGDNSSALPTDTAHTDDQIDAASHPPQALDDKAKSDNDSTTLTQSSQAKQNASSDPTASSANHGDTTSAPVPAASAASAEKDAAQTPTSEPAKASTAPSSSAVGGDDPTEEELAFEAELNASLGMALDGGATKADGTRADSLVAGASGTTAGGLMVAGADQDLDNDGGDDDLFGGDTPPASSSAVKDSVKSEPNGNADSDGEDSLFGDGDEDADGDADMDADGDDDASSDEDMPLAGRSMVKNASSHSGLLVQGTASPSLPPAVPPLATDSSNDVQDVKPSPTASKPSSPPKKPLPKPAFGGFSIASSFDAPLSTFSPDVLLSTSLSGQVILYDLRCPAYTSVPAQGVHSLPLPSKVPPWCQSAIFNSTGDTVFVGRRNESVDEWDLRMPSFVRSLRLPAGSGPVYALTPMPNRRHIVVGSYDNIRLWDTQYDPVEADGKVPFKIVAGHHGASLSSMLVDASCRFLISASGDRGWMGASTEAVIVHDVKAL